MPTLESIEQDKVTLGYLYKQMNEIENALISTKTTGFIEKIEEIERDKSIVWNRILKLEEKIRNDWDLLNNPV